MRLLRRGARCRLPARARPFASHASAGSATAPPAAVTEWAAAWSTLRPIGILGGMGSFSTILYYQHVNRIIGERTGSRPQSPSLIWSADLDACIAWESSSAWGLMGDHIASGAMALERAGASCLLIACNTVHHGESFDIVQSAVSIPVLHIADCTAGAVAGAGVKKVGLLGTRNTTDEEESIYIGRLRERGVEVVVNDLASRLAMVRPLPPPPPLPPLCPLLPSCCWQCIPAAALLLPTVCPPAVRRAPPASRSP